MHIVCFRKGAGHAFGVLENGIVRELATGEDPFPSEAFARAARGEAAFTDATHPLAALTLLTPVPNPGKVICIGLNYVDHAKEGGNPIPDYPAVFLRVNSSLAAPETPLIRPTASDKFDYEAELAVVIGHRAHRVSEDAALAHVAGYSCFNDGSLRDYQRRSTQWTMGKNFDATGGFGPTLVTPDELPPGGHGLKIVSRLNGRLLQDGSTADMIFSTARLISILSEVMTLEPGDVIATGTPAGVGYPRKPPVFMKPGDVCEIEIEGIGVLRNPIAAA
jgi:2-keto-4-pentenoate hydratase/2-oxohepta-3-ene-1,7-dioic acid hydratase in catechol pathway